MFTKSTITFLILIQSIIGSPLQSPRRQYDVSSFLSSRIVGGQEAAEGRAKYMVALVTDSWVKSLVCGGSIISESRVLSAAHCIEPFVVWGELSSSFKGVIGSNYWNYSNAIEFKDFAIHPDWSWANLKNDIGILTTARKIVFNDRVAPIALNFDWIDGGVQGFVTGWGRLGAWEAIPYRLQILYVNIISPQECVEGIDQAAQMWGSAPPLDPAVEICTFHSRGHGMCNGDSGSALVVGERAVGVVSWGFPCALRAPDVFVRIGAYERFVHENLGTHAD